MRKASMSFGLRRRRLAATAACIAAGWLLVQPLAFGQSATPPAETRPASQPGIFETIGRWFDKSTSTFRDHLRGAKRKMDEVGDEAAANSKQLSERAAEVGKGAAEVGKNAAAATRSAVDAVARLPVSRIVEGRERCGLAPNGAPDCVAAAEALCRKKGYSSGQSMDFTSAEQCPPRVLLGQASRDECQTVTFISRAMCR
jgi:hypothetical protein